VGSVEGSVVGRVEGNSVGMCEGAGEGSIVGLSLGDWFGADDGVADGWEDGLEEGNALGMLLGDVTEGEAEGLFEGARLGRQGLNPDLIAHGRVVHVARPILPDIDVGGDAKAELGWWAFVHHELDKHLGARLAGPKHMREVQVGAPLLWNFAFRVALCAFLARGFQHHTRRQGDLEHRAPTGP